MKLAIIGAGPGGLYAALEATKHNIRVDLYEKRKVGEGIVCGECIFDTLGIMPPPGEGLLHPVREVVLKGSRDYPIVMSKYRNLWMMDRKTWQQGLAKKAAARGVRIFEQTTITPARLLDMQKEYAWIIDGSGVPSVTARAYRFTGDYFQEFTAAYQVVLKGDFSALLPRIKVGFFSDLPTEIQPGYYWIFPKDSRHANVGVICTAHNHLDKGKMHLKERLAAILKQENLANAEVLEKGGGIASSRILPHLVFGNILLIGDAAGLTSPLHGGGIDTACLSGVMAVTAIIKDGKGVRAYEQRLARRLKDKLALEAITIQKMRTLSFTAFDELLAGVTSRSKITRAKIALRHPDLLYATYKWLRKKRKEPCPPRIQE